ncbi:hypothetical protein COY87_04200 [Candidatus Roizmanbacteria bacterium CG_4_10_14_0_8_um_filter_33_9]|uniref:DUF3096 domain-containing protein n=1 Tax=Candidatus Roizmanbacteria bacterium CG_4_10_14_0_8_um_filter_33_9 TaxID=1974826 RepID=A0A2M7QIG2_9BACT|nr:MAG: hypothetical protein COY87_04200 [Candidatus Roizmanbacteria bacterium CG_4_10_14_0_8_um_filter_33_9]
MPKKKTEEIPDPLENLKEILGFIIALLSIFFTKIFPLFALGLLFLLGVVYFIFKLLGLT